MNPEGGPFIAVDPASTRARCPRCDYDLSGTVDNWRDSCPLVGVCSECGLAIDWDRVLRAGAAPHWSCEHVARLSAWRVLKTGLRTLWPWTFWGALRLDDQLVPRRLAVMLLKCILAAYLIGVVVHVTTAVGTFAMWASRGGWWVSPAAVRNWLPSLWATLEWPWVYGLGWGSSNTLFTNWSFLCIVCFGVALPSTLNLLPTTTRTAKIRQGHLYRASAFMLLGHISLMLIALLISSGSSVLATFAQLRGWLWTLNTLWAAQTPVFRLAVHLLWSLAFWWAFVVVYLRLKHSKSAAILLALLGLLVTFMAWIVPTGLGIIQVWSWR
ncbi:MAG: hypothetical protein ACKVZJ_08235 [Phycisphaerales bacterium]